eukprot:6027277-Pyramimonas_sp.AAC.4
MRLRSHSSSSGSPNEFPIPAAQHFMMNFKDLPVGFTVTSSRSTRDSLPSRWLPSLRRFSGVT